MKLKTILSSLIIILFVAIGSTAQAKNLKVDKTKSSVEWLGRKLAGEHSGIIKIKTGQLEFLNGELVSGFFAIDMASLENTDLKRESSKRKIEDHLKSPDFFGVKKYPVATMTLIKIVKKDKEKYSIIADLTIKGKTKSVEFNATMHNKGDMYILNAKILIDRTKYGIRYGSGSFFDNLGDKTIKDIFELNISLFTE